MRSPLLPLRSALLLALLPCLGLSSCLLSQNHVNQPIPREAVAKLVPGMSAAEVVAILGAPVQVVELDQRAAYRFEFERTKQTGLFLFVFNWNNEETSADRIWCFFSKDDHLTHVGTTYEADEVEYGLG
jgi:outer membrane protein assembly factor BamE (lipoprotein component of BamABCDE complex)